MTARAISFAVMIVFLVSTGICGVATAQDKQDEVQEIAWFDIDHCEICKNFASMKHSMHKIKWENHLLDDGMISVSIVPDDMKEEMDKANAGIQETVAKLQQGAQLDMCGHCHFLGKLMGQGAKFKELKSLGVDISIVTSSDPDIVKEIHEFAKQSEIEHEKMLEKIKSESSSTKDR